MRGCWVKLLLIILILSIPVSAGQIRTVQFDIGNLQIDNFERVVRYESFESIRDSGYPSVLFDRLYFSVGRIAAKNDITGIVLSADTIDLEFSPVVNQVDRITADIDFPVTQLTVLDREKFLYPARSVKVSRQIICGRTVWTVMVFPVQYLGDNRIVFNHQIAISASNEELLAHISNGISGDNLDTHRGSAYMKSPSISSGYGCPLGNQYVIVTSPELAEAFSMFLDLKMLTGFDAALAITDSIFSNYSGIDHAEALRNYLAGFYNAGGAYVLLGGDENHVPVRYAYYYNTEVSLDPEELMICDLYFADFDGDWDADGDGIWGEPAGDLPDLGAEVAIGRLPFSDPEQVITYTKKLYTYLFDPGDGDRQYLNRSIFITSDQMRDYFGDSGQQHYIANAFPAELNVDCDQLAEAPTGDAPAPTGPFPAETVSNLNGGYGLINILAHGRPDGFILNSSEYNQFPKSYLLTGEEHIGNGAFDDFSANQKMGFYYSISCSQAAIDLETVYDMAVPSVVEKLLELDSTGAVGIIGFSRWGWVGSSYRLMTSFYEHLFDDAEGYPVEAMYSTYIDFPYYLDQIYGQNYYGDPSLRVYLDVPAEMQLSAPAYYDPMEPLNCRVTLGGKPLTGHPVTVKIGEDHYETAMTNGNGNIELVLADQCTDIIEICAFIPGAVSASATVYASIAADVDDGEPALPEKFELYQNYPNPFNPTTTIRFTLTRHQQVTLQVYDILGRLISSPLDGYLAAGEHQVNWNGTDSDGNQVSSGVYLYRIISGEGADVKKMMLVK